METTTNVREEKNLQHDEDSREQENRIHLMVCERGKTKRQNKKKEKKKLTNNSQEERGMKTTRKIEEK